MTKVMMVAKVVANKQNTYAQNCEKYNVLKKNDLSYKTTNFFWLKHFKEYHLRRFLLAVTIMLQLVTLIFERH